jgi:hypothetical protein
MLYVPRFVVLDCVIKKPDTFNDGCSVKVWPSVGATLLPVSVQFNDSLSEIRIGLVNDVPHRATLEFKLPDLPWTDGSWFITS